MQTMMQEDLHSLMKTTAAMMKNLEKIIQRIPIRLEEESQ